MKKLFKTSLLAVFIILTGLQLANTQIRVANNFNVGIGTDTPVSKLSIGGDGNSSSKVFINNPSTASGQRGLHINQARSSSSWCYGLISFIEPGLTSGLLVGVYGSAYRGSTAYSQGQGFGVKGQSGNATSGYNYSVYGELLGSNYGAAIFGAVPGMGGTYLNGMWAGYFRGNVNIENGLYVNGVYYSSDVNLKKDIRGLEKGNLDKLASLDVIKYKLKSPFELGFDTMPGMDTVSLARKQAEMDAPMYHEDRIGLNASQLKSAYPELIKTDNQGFMHVDYMGLVPVLVAALREQNEKIAALEKKVELLSGRDK